eukprot:TRINITY_DN333_c3_g1_i2.p2 TRINITY_DN333_c3_g1~~TRINITY_DN333_c3_g1_i2.p2  ORF type:complete len:275 (-),score=120.13 TRINITY_DN333_c3_g1_i2:1761-2585(-)
MGISSSTPEKDSKQEDIVPENNNGRSKSIQIPKTSKPTVHEGNGTPPDDDDVQRYIADSETSVGVPTVFQWKHGGKQVFIAGSFNHWKKKLPMMASHNEFSCIQSLEPGTYYVRFIVDGKWQVNPELPVVRDPNGELNNVVEVQASHKDSLLLNLESSSPPGDYGQSEYATPVGSSSNQHQQQQEPPALPPHLLRALLNATPTSRDPTVLPLPHHTLLNHFYAVPRKHDNVVVLGVTQRYRSRFITTVYYKPAVATAAPEPAAAAVADRNRDGS